MAAEALFQAERVMFEMQVPPERMENNSVPRYQLVIKLPTKEGIYITGHKVKQENSLSLNAFSLSCSKHLLSPSLCLASLNLLCTSSIH